MAADGDAHHRVEAEPRAPYGAPVSMIFGAESRRFNPFYARKNPQDDWQRMHAEVTWDVIPGNHGEFWEPPYIGPMTERLGERVDMVRAVKPRSSAPVPVAVPVGE